MRATIQWSYDLLDSPEQVLLRRLSVFAGSFDLAAAEAVTAMDDLAEAEVNALLGGLVERSMVAVESGVFGRRFRLLESMRQFAAEHLAEAGETDLLGRRHAIFVQADVTRIGTLLAGNDEIEGAARLAELWPNVRAAVDWGFTVEDRGFVRDLLIPIGLQSFVRRGLGEIAVWAERLVAVTPADDEETVALALVWSAMWHSMTQNREHFRRLYTNAGSPDHIFARYAFLVATEDETFAALEVGPRVVAEMRGRGHETYARLFEMFTAAAIMTSGDFAEARRRHQELADLFRAEGPPSFLTWTLYLLGASAAFQGDHELADHYWEESVRIEVPPRTNSPNETLSARAAFRRGHRTEAFRILRSYVDELIEADNMAGVALVGIEFVNMMVTEGRLSDAGVLLGHFDATGLLAVEGPGFKMLIEDALATVSADRDAAGAQEQATTEGMDEMAALAYMREVLADLIDAPNPR
ncbi:MAG: hypothetical protein ACE5GB_14225 [Acidimicrobiales bacterium]